MDHDQLVISLAADLVDFMGYLKGIKKNQAPNNDILNQYLSTCAKLYAYCKDITESKSCCSDIHHSELLSIFEGINIIKAASGNFSFYSVVGLFELISNLKPVLDANFYDGYAIIQGIREPIGEVEKNELKRYVEKGKFLKTSDLAVKLKEELASLKISGSPSFYSALIGPSLMGKTQMAFTLSHLMNVFYVNFTGFYEKSTQLEQPIYRALRPLSHLFFIAVHSDISRTDYLIAPDNKKGTEFFRFKMLENKRFKILGLIYTLLKWKSIHLEFEDPEAWFKSFWGMKSIVFQPLSISQFHSKIEDSGFSLDDCLVFSDELHADDDSCKSIVCFLRNLCRSVFMPSMLSGSNSIITTLIDPFYLKNSAPAIDEDPKPWVKMVTKTPHVLLQCLGCSIDVKVRNGTVKLAQFIENNELQYDRLLTALEINSEDAAFVKSILKFLVDQSKTALPGLISVSIAAAFEELGRYREDSFELKNFWPIIVDKSSAELCKRKKKILSKFGMISTAHILTFPPDLKQVRNSSSKTVDEHYFYYGPKPNSIFNLCVSDKYTFKSSHLMYSDRSPFNDLSYFPDLQEDFMLTIACLNSWFKRVDASGKMLGTLAHYYQIYLNQANNYQVESNAIVQDSFSVELLAFWCICFASHLSEIGRAGTCKVVEFFVQNIQYINSCSDTLKPLEVPLSLSQFLERIEVPYLLPGSKQDLPVVQRVSEFMKMGNSYHLASAIGWDVAFEVKFDSAPTLKECYIKCKLWESSVGIPMIYKYYVKACRDSHPISILVAKSFQESLETPEILAKTKHNQVEAAEKEPLVSVTQTVRKSGRNIRKPDLAHLTASKRSKKDAVVKTPKEKESPAKTDYVDLLEALWNDPRNHINLYTIKYDESDFSFKCTALKEFDDPVGVFLVVNSTFSPPTRSGHN